MMSPLSLRSLKQRLFSGFRLRWPRPAALALVAALAVLSACTASGSSTTNTSTNGTSSATATAAPTATPKPKPTSVPTTSVAYCQGLLSLTEANNIMQPAAAATTIVPYNISPVASCNYESSPGRYALIVIFLPFPPGTSVSAIEQQLLTQASQAEAQWTITTTPVSGVGDQALYATGTATLNGLTGYAVGLATTYGQIAIGCENYGFGSAPPLQAPLTQVCSQVISRL